MRKMNTKGYTLVELVTVMAIMGILGTMLVTMMNTGGRLYRNANTVMDAQNNARLAVSYITVKIRQNDVSNGISVDKTSYSVPVLKINDSSVDNGYTYWIYFDGSTSKLREQYGNTGFNSVLGSGAEIADISYFDIEQSGTDINFEVKSADGTVDLTQDLTLRSQ